MTYRLLEHVIKTGTVTNLYFNQDCQSGDWQEIEITFDEPFPAGLAVHVIITATDFKVSGANYISAVVGVAKNVTVNGFVLAARSSDTKVGYASLNWMAIALGIGLDRGVSVRMGVVQPHYFQKSGDNGSSSSWALFFNPAFDTAPVISLSANNLNVVDHNAAAVGIAGVQQPTGFILNARNSDCMAGHCNFYYLALAWEGEEVPDIWVDMGSVGAKSFAPDCQTGDWQSWEIQFYHPFLTPPIVLVTANDVGIQNGGHNAAVVGIAQNVNTHGFTLAGRNSDCTVGGAGFYWVAFGCGLGCG